MIIVLSSNLHIAIEITLLDLTLMIRDGHIRTNSYFKVTDRNSYMIFRKASNLRDRLAPNIVDPPKHICFFP